MSLILPKVNKCTMYRKSVLQIVYYEFTSDKWLKTIKIQEHCVDICLNKYSTAYGLYKNPNFIKWTKSIPKLILCAVHVQFYYFATALLFYTNRISSYFTTPLLI